MASTSLTFKQSHPQLSKLYHRHSQHQEMITKIVLYVYKYIFINILKWNVGGMGEYLAEAATDTLYKMCF